MRKREEPKRTPPPRKRRPAVLLPPGPRERLAALMAATIADHANWTYRQARPLAVPESWKAGDHVVGDCSKGVQYLCRWADCPDPMGDGFGGWGNSSTLCAHLQHLATHAELEVGDIVTFGPNGDEHAAMVKEPGADPLLWSFGRPGSPDSYRLSQDGRQAQYLRLPVPAFVPPVGAKLRAETGYWAWVQWRLGEGDWRGLIPADSSVRPSVPKLIPPLWWARYGQFLAHRQGGNPPRPPHGI